MLVERLTAQESQAQAKATLERLTSPGIEGQFQTFLLAARVDGLSDASLTYYRNQLGAFIRYCRDTGIMDARDVEANHIRLFLLKLQQTNNPFSVTTYYKAVKRFFNWLVTESILKDSPLKTIKAPKLPKLVMQPFTHEDIAAILTVCSGDKFLSLRNKAMALLLLDTGLRLAELAGIKLADMDFDAETIRVRGKGAKERIVHIGKVVQRALLQYLLSRNDTCEFLWVSEERHAMTKDGIRVTIVQICKRAGVSAGKHGPHRFRHTAAIMSLRNGLGEFTLQMMLGHSTLKQTRAYVSSLGAEDLIKQHRIASPMDRFK